MILLWGIDGDGPMDAVRHALDAAGTRYYFANQREPARLQVRLDVDADGCATGEITLGRQRVALEEITAVYARPYASRNLGATTPNKERHAWTVDAQLSTFADLCEGCVLNPPQAMASNQSKPYQLNLIRQHGFEIPDTLLTTDPAAARHFWQRHGNVIYKSISGTRSIVRRLQSEDAPRLEDVSHAPTQFQEYVPGRDIRVHVIGNACHATAIDSGADDYRYAQRQGNTAELVAIELPRRITEQCIHLSHNLGLRLSGIDLRRTADDRWFCFEVNPSPAFTYYEENTGQPLAAEVAHLLSLAS